MDRASLYCCLASSMMSHPFKSLLLLGGVWFAGAFVGPETNMSSIKGALQYSQMFTNLPDKNSVEIYEGDIVKHILADEYGKDVSRASIEWEVKRGRFIMRWQDGHDHLGHATFDRVEFLIDYEVIGNIWENKELLND